LLVAEIVAAFKQAGNVASSINPVGEADYPYDYTQIQSLFSISGDFFFGGYKNQKKQYNSGQKIQFIVGKKMYEVVNHRNLS
jgi:hypothetical protein